PEEVAKQLRPYRPKPTPQSVAQELIDQVQQPREPVPTERPPWEGEPNFPPEDPTPVPEAPATLQEQQQQLVQGQRRAQLFPKGTEELPLPEGMKKSRT